MPSLDTPTIVGIDIGGTFTDFVILEQGHLRISKVLSTPADPSQALLKELTALNVPLTAEIVHGSTIATNALLERRGARTALIATQGFGDILEIGRQNRPDIYQLVPQKPDPLVPPELRFEIHERVDSHGFPLVPLDPSDLAALVNSIHASGVESVAVSLLFSFLYPDHEKKIGDSLRNKVFVSLSSEILPEYREYERTSTTVINAYVTPIMDTYLEKVESGLDLRRLRIMQSNGGVITASTARREAVRTVLSGPAGGAVGAFHVAQQAGFDHVISFDMGGTSTDVALFPGSILRTREAMIGGMPLRTPVVDIHTVGAGGGSIARVDAGGALQVGPHSAGADPGPACYGKGDQPTTSDANLILGRLNAQHFLGGAMPLDRDWANQALTALADEMNVAGAEQAAWGVIQIANAAMERAIRAISVERGYDPREFILVAFGGSGPLHACAIASALRITRVLVPLVPGVLSALGMTIADLVKDVSQSLLGQEVPDLHAQDTIFASLEARALAEMAQEGVPIEHVSIERALDMRYKGQSHEITVSEPADGNWLLAFHLDHQRLYGHRHDQSPVEYVNARVKAVGESAKPDPVRLTMGGSDPQAARLGTGQVWFSAEGPITTPFFQRDQLLAGNEILGPAIIFQLDTTIVIDPMWLARVDEFGNLVVSL